MALGAAVFDVPIGREPQSHRAGSMPADRPGAAGAPRFPHAVRPPGRGGAGVDPARALELPVLLDDHHERLQTALVAAVGDVEPFDRVPGRLALWIVSA
jgi:hypothetical protein